MATEFYVYAHRRKDTGQIFYIGKGCNTRSHHKASRTAAWHAICDEAGGFDVEIIAANLTDEKARSIEAQKIAELRPGLVNFSTMDNRAITQTPRVTINTSMDPELVSWLKDWCKSQPAEVPFGRAIDACIKHFLEQQEARSS